MFLTQKLEHNFLLSVIEQSLVHAVHVQTHEITQKSQHFVYKRCNSTHSAVEQQIQAVVKIFNLIALEPDARLQIQ